MTTTSTSTRPARSPEEIRLRNELSWHLWLRRGALRSARRHSRSAAAGTALHPGTAAELAGSYTRDAERDSKRIAQLRAELASLTH